MFWKDTRQKQRQGNNSNFQILLNAGVRELTNKFAEIKKTPANREFINFAFQGNGINFECFTFNNGPCSKISWFV